MCNINRILQCNYHWILVLFLGSISSIFSQQSDQNSISTSILDVTNVITIVDIKTIQESVINKDVQFVDIRTPKEYEAGYIDDAINISIADKEKFLTTVQKLDKEKPIYIYCYSGWRSHRAAKLLASIGFRKIYDFKGGYKAWTAY